jgi:hypothetical protein
MNRLNNYIIVFSTAMVAGCATTGKLSKGKGLVLHADEFKHYVDYFNGMEDENIKQAIPNDSAWPWMKANIPLFECPQQNLEEIFYFRWWTLRKHIKQTPEGFAFTEFLINRSYADKYNLIACAMGHHINEARWLHDQRYLDQYVHVWYRGNEGKPMKKLHGFSSWATYAIYNRYLVNKNKDYLVDMLPDLESDYRVWEDEKKLPSGLFWQTDVKDGMEETISGGRREKNERPTINSYMYGNARALATMAALKGDNQLAALYTRKADTLKQRIQTRLWNKQQQFFEVRKEADTLANVKEEVGFIPWYFNLPDAGYETAWKSVSDEKVFDAPFGITTADRSHPAFRTHGCCKCEWDGAVWPFATSQTLTALANVLNNYPQQKVAGDTTWFNLLNTFVESQYYRGRPYVGEYLDEKTGYWLKGDEERSRYYNHSTFNDLIITGLVGLRPREDEKIEVNPLLPEGTWDWFCLDNVWYHGKTITIIWDKDGSKYKKGKGLSVWINGVKKGETERLEKIVVQ